MSDDSRFLQPPRPARDAEPKISRSPGFVEWMLAERLSLAFTSYNSGGLIVAGVAPDGRVAFNEQYYGRAMGLDYRDGTLTVASLFQIWRLRNLLNPGEFANGAYDCVLAPRQASVTGYLDVHELGVGDDGRVVFVSSLYSCLATTDERFSFRPLWQPPFVTALAAEDRCHLNGLAMADGRAKYVTAVKASDAPAGWRDRPDQGGVLIDVEANRIVTDSLSMPHSPRVREGAVWLLESGRGQLVKVDPATGAATDVAFCPGFARGMAIRNGFAVVAVSALRPDSFALPRLRAELDRRKLEDWSGILVIDLERGIVAEHMRYEAGFTELFDVAILDGIRNPTTVGPATEEILSTVRPAPGLAPAQK
jgi:uncharacterized protein (TIGR03032 family)